MPQAPGLTPDVNPSTEGTPDLNIGVPVDAFGGAVGQALSNVGQDITHASDQIWQRAVDIQNLNNETSAKDADAQYMIQSGKIHADFLNKEGTNAGPEALAKHIQDLQDLRTNLRQGLNPMAAKMYDASSLSFMGRNIFNAAGHSGQQVKVASNNASTSRKDVIKNNIEANPDDEVAFQRGTRAIQSENERIADNNGMLPEQLQDMNQKDISDYWAKRITGLSRTNAIGAQRMFNTAVKNKALIAPDADRVQATVQTQFRDQGSRIIADKVLADRRAGEDGEDEKTEDDYVQEGMDEVDKYKTDDPLFKDFVRDRIITQYKKQKMIERDTDDQNVRTIGTALLKTNEEGYPPTSLEELKAQDPNVAPAWDALSRQPKVQQQILSQLQRNATSSARQPVTTENLQQFHTWKGIAMGGTDDERASFMAHNFAAEPKMAISQKSALMNLQDSMRKQSQSDPRVARALNILKPDMVAAGIDPRGGDENRQSYYQYTGALADALEQYQTDHPGKMPSVDEVKTIGAQLMQEHTTGRAGWLIFNSERAPFYQMPVPQEEYDRIKSDGAWAKRGINPTDSMIQRIYHAEQFRKLYGGHAPANDQHGQFPPNAPNIPESQ